MLIKTPVILYFRHIAETPCVYIQFYNRGSAVSADLASQPRNRRSAVRTVDPKGKIISPKTSRPSEPGTEVMLKALKGL